MILDPGSPRSEVVDIIHTHLHTLNIHCLDNLGRSPDLGLAFLVAKNDLGKSSSTQCSWSRLTYAWYEAYRGRRNRYNGDYRYDDSTSHLSVYWFKIWELLQR